MVLNVNATLIVAEKEIGNKRTFKAGKLDNLCLKATPMLSVRNAPQTAPAPHLYVFAALTPNYRTPQFTPDIDSLVAAVERLACCPDCAQKLIVWLVEGRFGPDYQTALERIVLALATREAGQ